MKYQALRPHFISMVGGWGVVGWFGGWVVGGRVGHGVGGWWWGASWGGWGWGGVVGPHDTPHHGGCHMPPPMLFFDNLVKK